MPRKLSALVAIVFVAALLLPATQAIAAPATVTGTITIREKVTLSPNAVAFISIVGQQADSSAGGIVGYQRIDDATTPVEFSVPYDTTAIDPKQSYALFASIVDGSTAYQSFEPVPVITGGPTSGVTLVATDKPPACRARSPARYVMPPSCRCRRRPSPSPRSSTRRPGRWCRDRSSRRLATSPIAFSIAVDVGVIDPTDTYVAKAGDRRWQEAWAGLDGVPAVDNGKLLTGVTVAVTTAALPSPAPTAEPTAAPTPSRPRHRPPSPRPSRPRSPRPSPRPSRPPSRRRANAGAHARTHAHAGAHAHPGSDADTCANARTNAHARTNAVADPGSDADPDACSYPDARSDGDAGAHTHRRAHADARSDAVAHAGPDAHPDTEPHAGADPVSDARADPVADGDPDAPAGHRRHHGHARLRRAPQHDGRRTRRRPARRRHGGAR